STRSNRGKNWQEWRDSNPRPSVLETDALPTELHSCGRVRLYRWRAGLASEEAVPTFPFRGGLLFAPRHGGRKVLARLDAHASAADHSCRTVAGRLSRRDLPDGGWARGRGRLLGRTARAGG